MVGLRQGFFGGGLLVLRYRHVNMYLSVHTLMYLGTYINGKGKKKQTTRYREATVGST